MKIENMEISETGLFMLDLDDVQFPGGFGSEVSPLESNVGSPVIAVETEDGFRLIDGWGRVSGLINAGAEQVQAILIDADDLAHHSGEGDDEWWSAAIYRKYTSYEYAATTN